MLTEMETVIRTEDDHGAVGELLPIEFIEHLANLRVHEGDVGEVTMADFANGLGSERTLCVTANFAPVVSGDARGVRWPARYSHAPRGASAVNLRRSVLRSAPEAKTAATPGSLNL